MVAVKKLFDIHVLDDNKFRNEVCYLMDVNHPNIVRFLGYCAETRMEVVQVNKKYVMAELPTRLLCFEYLRNKSLDTHISGMKRQFMLHSFEIKFMFLVNT